MNKYIDYGDIVALLTWGLLLGITIHIMPNAPQHIQDKSITTYLLFVAYAVCFVAASRDETVWPLSRSWRLITLWLMLAFSFGLMLSFPVDYLPILTVIWAAMLPHFYSFRNSILFILIAVSLWFFVYAQLAERSMFLTGLLYGAFHLFAAYSHFQFVSENRAKLELQLKNQQLLATQKLLSEASKQAERNRIARDVHDVLGHHLTALTINLQVASHLVEGEAKDKVEQCHSIAKLLLSDVRDTVSTFKQPVAIDLATSIKALVDNVPVLTISLQMPDDMQIEKITIAEALLRIVQEAITNTLKHSNADKMTIQFQQQAQMVKVEIMDNGTGCKSIEPGHGLKGMQERLQQLNANLSYHVENGHLRLLATVPLS